MDIYDNNEPPGQTPITSLKKAGGTSVAVALKAPINQSAEHSHVVASGRGELADEIIALAHAKGIKVREDADLAQMLSQLDLDTPIPSEAIVAVAEILAKVYEANTALSTCTGKDS